MSRMTVNERPVEFDLDPRMPLLYALREAMNLTGTKACGGGSDCSGACMVLVDGVALRSCAITLAEAEGRLITTIEGLSRDRSHPVQQAMVELGGSQCGYCTPGFIMSLFAEYYRDGRAEGELDFKGTLGVDPDARVGFRTIRLVFDVQSDASDEDLEAALETTRKYCVVFQTLVDPPELSLETA